MTTLDESAATTATRARGLLRDFNRAGVLSPADVHVATRLGALTGEDDDDVLLAVALVVRSTRHGSVVVDLETVRESTVADDEDGQTPDADDVPLPWPDAGAWVVACARSPLTAGAVAPVRQVGARLWLARYWQQEQQVADELLARAATAPDDLDLDVLRAGVERLFGPDAGGAEHPDDAQRVAAVACALARVSVLAGGPGTGKTTTVSRLLALLREQHPGCRIALAAPTGKAAARLEEAVRSSAARLPAADRERLADLLGNTGATTLHRLLGWRPGARSRFRHDRTDRLPFDVVVVDESSMVSLTLMARLLEALRPHTRLVLVGDSDQLASVEAGAVLGDLVDRATLGRRTPAAAEALRAVLPGADVRERAASPQARVGDGVSALTTNHRFAPDSAIAALARAVLEGDGEAAVAVLRSGREGVELVEVDDEARLSDVQLAGVRADVVAGGAALHSAAAAGDARSALTALDRHRLLCAHRLGPRGVQHWGDLAAAWVAEQQPVLPSAARSDGRYAGEPLLITSNDYDAGLFNGDTGVVVDDARGGLVAVFGRGGEPFPVSLARLGAVRPLHAMTVHRSQGSQFERVTVLLPAAGSPLATRETVYTAVTRATRHVRVVGSAAALLDAVSRPAARATGLRERLREQAGD